MKGFLRLFSLTILLVCSIACHGQDVLSDAKHEEPAELQVLKTTVGVWDAEFEVWPQGLDNESIKFKGVETNRAFGKHWITSDLKSKYMGQVFKNHTIIGYDLDKKTLVGTSIDDGPYSARMTGKYDPKTKTVTWKTEAKAINGQEFVQKTTITQKTDTVRTLVLSMPAEKKGEFKKFMKIKFTRRRAKEPVEE